MSAQPEVWRVSTVEGVFETDLDTLKQWISEGSVLPTDKVSKGSLNWIDAGKVPKLKPAFNGEVVTPRDSSEPEPAWATTEAAEQESYYRETQTDAPDHFPVAAPTGPADACLNHPERPTHYICRVCSGTFCAECPNLASGNVPLCPRCGDLCRVYEDLRNTTARREFQSSGFGFSDFKHAITYPFQHKAALLGGALLYGLLLLAGFRGSLVAWMIMFGCISHVISQVAWGRLDRSFMPDFSEFSLLDDLVVPVFLGIGITIVTWGPVIALILALALGVVGPSASAPGDQDTQKAHQSGPTPEELSVLTDPDADPAKLEEANKKLDQLRPGVQMAQEAERSKNERSDPTAAIRMLMPYLGAGIVLLLFMLIGVLWAIFYYPMALTVAGYTQSFVSVVNPMVGLDTIRRMGSTYFKAFGMVLSLEVIALIMSGTVAMITAPFALPLVGNLPANFINGIITFYFNLVIACVLGLSLHKCADRLGIDVD